MFDITIANVILQKLRVCLISQGVCENHIEPLQFYKS